MIAEVHAKTHGTGRGIVDMDGLLVDVTVKDARKLFGRVDVLVTPVSGQGEKWIDLGRIKEVTAEWKPQLKK